jgi:hypothetical protein
MYQLLIEWISTVMSKFLQYRARVRIGLNQAGIEWVVKQTDLFTSLTSLFNNLIYQMPFSMGFFKMRYLWINLKVLLILVPTHVYRKSLYGLKQAPRAWFDRLTNSLLEFGFHQSLVDTFLFVLHCGSQYLFLLVYVDDILVIGSHVDLIQSLLHQLKVNFALKDLGQLSFFSGI